MFANVAKAGRAEQGVGDRVKDDVGIAVAGEAAAVRDFDAAEHDRAVAGEGVDVESHAGARPEAPGQPLFGAFEIRGKGQLLECRIALNRRHLHA
jgi:hypothetical protein